MQNYHWTEINITSTLAKKIKDKLKELNYTPSLTEIEGSIFNRMNTKRINYFFTIKSKKEDSNDILEMTDFSPQSTIKEIKCTNENDKSEFYNFVKFLENEFTQKSVEYQEEETPFLIYKLTCKKEEFYEFMFNPDFITKWCLNFKKNTYFCYDNVIIKNVNIKNDECEFYIKNSDKFYKCRFVINDDLYLRIFLERKSEFVNLFNALFTQMGGAFGFRFNLVNE